MNEILFWGLLIVTFGAIIFSTTDNFTIQHKEK